MYNTESVLVVDINNINFPIALDSLETVEELEDFVRTMHPYHEAEYEIIEARNMPLAVNVEELSEPNTLQRLLDFNMEDSDTQELIIAFAAAERNHPPGLFSLWGRLQNRRRKAAFLFNSRPAEPADKRIIPSRATQCKRKIPKNSQK